jgi:hypothetical protein
MTFFGIQYKLLTNQKMSSPHFKNAQNAPNKMLTKFFLYHSSLQFFSKVIFFPSVDRTDLSLQRLIIFFYQLSLLKSVTAQKSKEKLFFTILKIYLGS